MVPRPASCWYRGRAQRSLERWIDEIDVSRGVLVTAQGLLMYVEPRAVRGLIATCARRLPGGELVFDGVPGWLSKNSQRGALKTACGYQAPPWLWSMNAAEEERRLASLHPNITELRALRLPRGRGALHGFVIPTSSGVPPLRRRMLAVFRARFGPGSE